ncbi:recombinase family protein [Actinophytocola sp. NPDC049390]|uniref:recombinase family protein n=1 Tax=Actinophytocola sp. NPDC049390 TaxID=3363894 RepID=UPI00379A9406
MTVRKVGIYVRISRDRVGAGLGVDRQEQDCRDLAKRLGWPVVSMYSDNDVSAYSGRKRPSYERLLADIGAGRITAVVAWHADRLHRSQAELERYITLCEPRDVPTHTVRAGELDLTTASGRMTARIIGAVARHESEQKGERLRRQRAQAQADGRWIGGPRPFGFEPDGVTHRASEADAIRDAATRILAGDSIRSVFQAWNERGLTTSTGTEWNGSKVRQMLLRPRNAGLIGNGDRIVGKANWEPIVPEETWRALAAKLRDPARLTHRGVSKVLLGTHLYRCGKCGALMQGGGQSAAGKARYRCKTDRCQWRVAEPIDSFILAIVESYLREHGTGLLTPRDDAGPLLKRLNVLQARAEQVAAAFGDPDSGMTAEQFKASNKPIQDAMSEVKAQLGHVQAGSALAGVADAEDPGEAFRDADMDRQRAILDALLTVEILEAPHGRKSGGGYFDHRTVHFGWKAEGGECGCLRCHPPG